MTRQLLLLAAGTTAFLVAVLPAPQASAGVAESVPAAVSVAPGK